MIYKYSNKKLQKLLKFPVFGVIFRHFNSCGEMGRMMATDDTFSVNEQVYRKNLEEMLEMAHKSQ